MKMTEREKKIDEIDRQLFMLSGRSSELGEEKLWRAIETARSIAFYLLPKSRQKEVKG